MSGLVAGIPVALEKKDSMKYLFLLLFPASVFAQIVNLREVSVRPGQALEIVRKMLAAIPRNYDTGSFTMTASYQENIRLAGDTLNFNESELAIKGDQWKVVKYGRKQSFSSRDFAFYSWISNINNAPGGALHEDIIKYAATKYSILNPVYFRYYNYYLDTLLKDQLVIAVVPRNHNKKGFVRGRLFIDTASLALVRCELVASPAGIRHVNRHGRGGIRYSMMAAYLRASIKFEQIRVEMDYQKQDGKYYLHNVKRHWESVINSNKRGLKDAPWQADFLLSVNSVSAEKNLTPRDSLSRDKFFLNSPTPDSFRDSTVSWQPQNFTRADTLRGMLSPLRSCYDVTFYHLDAEVDLDKHFISGNSLIRYKVLSPFDKMQVDLYANMLIQKILFKGQSLNFTREANAVFIQFPGLQPAGEEQEITIYYEGTPQVPDKSISMKGGVLWDKDDLGNPWAQVVCQGSGASLWWPCKDHLSDEPDSMRIWITVPEGFSEVSNGRLQRQVPLPGHKTRYEWAVSYPINNYNVTFSIGKYTHYTDHGVNYYVMPYHLEQAKVYFSEIPAMLACYEEHFGPYPFPKDGFTLVESLYPMEHQSGVCVGRIPADPHPEFAFVVWHEAAHEWWGNNISCKDIADMWIHEAFATYAESVYAGCRAGDTIMRDFLNEQRQQVKNKRPVTGFYNVNDIFYDIDDMYTKGSLMLFTLQNVINDKGLWQRLLLAIQQHFRYQTLSAEELEQFICDFTGKDYHYFFRQYLHYTNIPRLEYELAEKGADLRVRYRWVADVPDFRMPVRVKGRDFIYPTLEWKMLTFHNQAAADFEIDDENFYIEAEELE